MATKVMAFLEDDDTLSNLGTLSEKKTFVDPEFSVTFVTKVLSQSKQLRHSKIAE